MRVCRGGNYANKGHQFWTALLFLSGTFAFTRSLSPSAQPLARPLTRRQKYTQAKRYIINKYQSLALSLPDNILQPAHAASYATSSIANIICNRVTAHVCLEYINTKCSEALHQRLIKTIITATPGFTSNTNPKSVLKLFDVDLETIKRTLYCVHAGFFSTFPVRLFHFSTVTISRRSFYLVFLLAFSKFSFLLRWTQ